MIFCVSNNFYQKGKNKFIPDNLRLHRLHNLYHCKDPPSIARDEFVPREIGLKIYPANICMFSSLSCQSNQTNQKTFFLNS